MNVLVKKSKIQGKGVFAARDLKKGKIVMKWDTSIVLIKKDALKIPLNQRKYLVASGKTYILAQSPEKFLNHSCIPNLVAKNHCDIAIRNIHKGEELTTDYSLNAPPHIKMKCACGSKMCKKIV